MYACISLDTRVQVPVAIISFGTRVTGSCKLPIVGGLGTKLWVLSKNGLLSQPLCHLPNPRYLAFMVVFEIFATSRFCMEFAIL